MLIYSVHGDNDLNYAAWLVLTRGIGRDPNDRNGENFRRFPHTKIVRLNHGYGSAGTIPLPQYYEDFAQRCANYVEMSPGCSRWIIGNEPNHRQERPEGQPITPRMYAECYTLCREAIRSLEFHTGDQVLLAAIAPWNVDTKYAGNPSGDWIRYFEDVQFELGVGGCDGFALHTYTREQTPAGIASDARMDPPFEHYHNGYRTYMDWMAATLPRFQGLPVYITEFCVAGEPWKNINTGCVQAAYAEIDGWNRLYPDRPISCLTMYRWSIDKWAFDDKPQVQADFNAAVEHGYSVPTTEPPEPPGGDMLNPSLELPYHRDSTNSTVNVAHDWLYFASDGKPPERDGPCQLPEYKSIHRSQDPHLVYDGDTAQCWFIRWKIFDAGIYQVIGATPGALYTPDVAAKAWCTDGDDENVSDGDMHVRLGIDPTGGTDPWSAGVIWSDWKRAGVNYQRVIGPIVEAEADHITFFIRAWNKWELSHNDIYVDDCHMVVEGGGTPPGGGECLMDWERMEALIETTTRRVVQEELEARDPVIWPKAP
jgi:hypothetical protein